MNLKKFDSLSKKDFKNNAVLDEIRSAIKENEEMVYFLIRIEALLEANSYIDFDDYIAAREYGKP